MFKKLLIAFGAMLVVAGCDSDSGNRVQPNPPPPPPPETFALQILHASPDAPAVNVLADGNEVVAGLDYKSGTAALELEVGTYSIQVDGILPNGTTTVIGPVDLTFDADTTYTVVAANDVANIEAIVASQDRAAPAAGNAKLFVIHGASAAPQVDVYVTAPGADLTASAPVGTFSFGETIGPAEVAAGDYQVRVTAAGDPAAVVFDTGTITLNDQDDLALTAVANTAGGAAPISLVGLSGAGSLEILDAATPAGLRVGHLSPDTPNVDVVVDGGVYLADVPFPAVTAFDSLPAATYNVAVQAAGNPGVVPIGPVDLTLDAGTWTSVLAVNTFSNIEPLILVDSPRPIATNAQVRIIHASPTAATVDIYVTGVGVDINTVDPLLPSVEFKDFTDYLGLDAGDYDVTVTPAGTKTAAIGPATISVSAGGVYTAIARDPLPGAMEFGLIVLDDLDD
ncbi:MAG: DUF4397 domain-containing protein [Pseudomonadota bacterium]